MPSSNDGHMFFFFSEPEKTGFLLNYFLPMKSDNTRMRNVSAFTVDFLFESRLPRLGLVALQQQPQLPPIIQSDCVPEDPTLPFNRQEL